MLKFLQTLALDGPGDFSREEEKFLKTNAQKIWKSGSSACSCMWRPQIFSVQSLGVKLCLFDIRFSYKHCLSHAVAYSSTWRWLPKRWQGLFDLPFEARFKKISKRKKSLVKPPYEGVQAQSLEAANRPCHGFRRHLDEKANAWEITLFVWESNVE